MDEHHDLTSLANLLQEILSSQPLPNSSRTTSPSSNNATPVLPPNIPPLPPTTLTLPPSPSPSPLNTLTRLLQTHILPYLNHSSLSPNYYGFVTGGTTPAALLADWLTSIYDQNLSVHLPAQSIATSVEIAALNLLVQLFNLPADEWGIGTGTGGGAGGGTITTGATASNVLGLAVGREWVVREAGRRMGIADSDTRCSVSQYGLVDACVSAGVSVQILSSLPHSSVLKAAAVVGIGRRNVIPIGMEGDALRIDVEKLEGLARAAASQGKAYILVVSCGEVNTGLFATDGLETMKRVRAICDEFGIWIHVDAAFGLFGRVLMGLEMYADLSRGVEGVELADSITGDGHKLLNVPYDCGLFFTRHKAVSEVVFSNGNAAYLTAAVGGDGVQSPMNVGIENSRRFRALPVWATLMAYGREGYVDMLRRQIGLAKQVVRWMCGADGLEVLPVYESVEEAVRRTYMVVLFRARDHEVNEDLVKRINGSGKIYVTGTKWEGQTAARIAVSNWQVNVERDFALIKAVIEKCLTTDE